MFFKHEDLQRFAEIDLNFISTEQVGVTFYITLNRPEKRNAYTPTMVNELAFALSYANAQPEIWCIVIRANGSVFCAGMDLEAFHHPAQEIPNQRLPLLRDTVSLGEVFRRLDKPAIAEVAGNVYAGGFLIIAGCTFVAACDDVVFSLPEAKRGLFPMQVLSVLQNCMPPRQALQLCILGEPISAKRAFDLGLVSHLCAKDIIGTTVNSLIHSITANSPYAISKGMDAYRMLSGIPDKEKYRFLLQKLSELRGSHDAQEGMKAFKEKRPPEWINR